MSSEPDNRCRWDGRSAGHHEVWYLTLNHRASGTGAWLRYTIEAPVASGGEPRAELWFAHFDARQPERTFGIHRLHPIASLRTAAAPFSLAIDGAELRHDGARGEIDGNGHRAAWDLSWTPATAAHRHLPAPFYWRDGLADATVLSPNPDVRLRGWIAVDGRRFELDGEPAGQGHLWGRRQAHGWSWARASCFDGGEDAFVEALTARVERAGRVLPPVTFITLRVGSEELRINGLRHALVNRGRSRTGHHEFSAWTRSVRVRGTVHCPPERMLRALYRDPDDAALYCAHSTVADLELTISRRERPFGRWREADRLRASGTTHLEIAGREPDPAVTRLHEPSAARTMPP